MALSLRIRFTTGASEVVEIESSGTVHDLRRKIEETCEPAKDKHVRLIFAGRSLADGEPLEGFSSGSVVHAVVSDRELWSGSGNTESQGVNNVGGGTSRGGSEERDVEAGRGGPRGEGVSRARGFERLTEMGIPEDEVAVYRRQFHAYRALNGHGAMNPESLLRLEEEFLTSQGVGGGGGGGGESGGGGLTRLPTGEVLFPEAAASMPEGSFLDFLSGMLVGFVLGLLSLFWIIEAKNVRMRVGALIGLMVNLCFGLMRVMMRSNDSN